MAIKVIILSTYRGEREDGGVNYCDYWMVSSETLKFDEPIFQKETLQEFADEEGYVSYTRLREHFQALGYKAEEIHPRIFWAKGYDK